nr:hemolysin III domain-containing protein [Naematelia aurantialba]
MSRPTTPSGDSGSGSWARRFSAPPLPNLPHPSGLRSAVLGYLAEVEAALRDRLAGDHGDRAGSEPGERGVALGVGVGVGDDSGPSDASTSTSGNEYESDVAYSYTSALPTTTATSSTVRQRIAPPAPAPSLGASAPGRGSTAEHPNTTLLRHLSTLREDVMAYLPSVPTPPSREWLRALPYKLSIFDLGLSPPAFPPGSPHSGSGSTSQLDSDGHELGLGHGHGGMAVSEDGHLGAVYGARQKVLELVHALLPSEEWAGWERLGWEDQLGEPLARSVSGSAVLDGLDGRAAEHGDDDDDDEEPEYLFPNRTPASAQALASRRRAVRSKSVGAAGMAWAPASLPARLARANTAPLLDYPHPPPSASASADSDEDEDEQLEGRMREGDEEAAAGDGEDAADIISHPDLLDTKLTPLVAPSHLGPTVTHALLKSDDGRVLITYDDLPFIWRNNEHIISGYRFIPLHASTGPIPLFKSAFTMHNETGASASTLRLSPVDD